MKRNCKLIFALDTAKKKDFIRWVDATKDLIEFYKVGLVPFIGLGNEAITILKKRKKKIFLDLKFFDIPNTMIKASISALSRGVDILDFHLLADESSLRQALIEIKRKTPKSRLKVTYVVGITLLTSTAAQTNTRITVLQLARKAKRAGFDGVVCSGKEAALVRKQLGGRFKIICPGIRRTSDADDQKRIVSPKEIKNTADFIVVGRPILQAKQPRSEIARIQEELR